MEKIYFLYLACFLLLPYLYTCLSRLWRKSSPPSPLPIPLLGHLYLLKQPIHRSLAALSSRHGPVLSLRFGSRPVLLITSSTVAEECFTKNDIIFANRPRFIAGKHFGYDYTALQWASYGSHWRGLRRITAIEIFSSARVDSFSEVREEEVGALVKALANESSRGGAAVEVRLRIFDFMLNVMMRMVAGRKFCMEDEEQAKRARGFSEVVKESFAVAGVSNPADFLPVLRLFGPNKHERSAKKLQKKRDAFFQELIEERRNAEQSGRRAPSMDGAVLGTDYYSGEANKCFIDVLLSLQATDSVQFRDEIIKGMMTILLIGGTDTSTLTVEWALALLLANATALAKVVAELDDHIGNSRLINESDLPNLPYLNSVIKETLRLRPVGPIIPHESSENCTVSGYEVPRGTMLYVNVWAIQRDPDLWPDPEAFRPERWVQGEEEEIQGRSKSGRFLAFGMGRRGCPGEAMAMRMIGLVLGALLHFFEWELGAGEVVDLSEGLGISMPMAKPLTAICKPRQRFI